jgi:hypothetical protein
MSDALAGGVLAAGAPASASEASAAPATVPRRPRFSLLKNMGMMKLSLYLDDCAE